MLDPTTKECSMCHQPKVLSEFHKGSHFKDGLQRRCKTCVSIAGAAWTAAHPEYHKSRPKYVPSDKVRENRRKASQAKRDKYPELHRQEYARRRDSNPEKIRQYNRESHRRRYAADEDYKIKQLLRTRMYQIIKHHKSAPAVELLGCTLDQFKEHISSMFVEGMSWSNHGEWHLDHITPCASFNCTKIEDQKACFHYTNLQPLWKKDNLSKGDR